MDLAEEKAHQDKNDQNVKYQNNSPTTDIVKDETNCQNTLKRRRGDEENDEHYTQKPKRKQNTTEEDSNCLESDSVKEIEKDEEMEASMDEVTQLSDSVFIYQNRKISDHGNVFEGEIRSGVYDFRRCAIKFARKQEQNVRESEILTKLGSHTHVISIIQSGIYKDMFDERVFIALEKCHEQNLHQHIMHQNEVGGTEFNLREAVEYSKQIIAGVTYVHEKLIIHKDLKPSNILLSQDKSTIKIADFGLSQEIKSASSKVYCKHHFGTNGFRPIESFGNNWVSLKSDNFSLGVVLYFVLSNGKSPFGEEISLWIHNTKSGVIDLSHLLVPNTNTFQHLIELMLSTERCCRPSIWQVADHPCWKGKEIECNFDYGHEEEVEDFDVEDIKRPEIDLADTDEMDDENIPELLRELDQMGYRASPPLQSSIIFFTPRPMRLQRFNPRRNSVTEMHEFSDEMKGKIYNFSTLCHGVFIYIFARPSVYRLNFRDDKAGWERMKDQIDDHGDRPPAVSASENIYIVGSCNGEETKSVSIYDPSSLNEWRKLTDKKLSTSWASIVALRGHIYSIGGGAEGVGITNRVERLELVSQTWDEVEPMREVRYGASGVACEGNIIVVGGVDPRFEILASVEKYDPNANQWTIMTPMFHCRRWMRCHFIKGCVYAVFGNDIEVSIEKYDIAKDKWQVVEFPNMEVVGKESVAVKYPE